ncbi:MAG: Crp/Fnr family transcriptional regulator [Pleurocapsa sp. SU_196_0]|nr:Crp/Fnr family transcriptional regulator [Pleurocapsa sp. SU_196_0]
MNLEARVAALHQTAWLRDASQTLLLELARVSSVQGFTRDAVLFLEGDAVETVFVLVSGFVRTYRFDPKRERTFTIGTYGTRQTLGVIAACLEPSRFTATAEAFEPGIALQLDATALRSLVAREASFAALTLRHVATRHAALTGRVSALMFADLNARVATLLLEHDEPSGWTLPTNSVLAAQLGTVPELVSRKLGEFYRRGWIRLEKRRVWVMDAVNLESQTR